MERQPIISQKEVSVKLIQLPLEISDMFPNYKYELQNGEVSKESSQMYTELLEFLTTNKELILGEPVVSREDYVKGFQRAIALTRLWIDSIYLDK